jgi:tyrosine-protein kinase Etk/Wzc
MDIDRSADSEGSEPLDLKAVFKKYLAFWPIILIGAFLGVGGAYIWNLYLLDRYSLKSIIEIKSNSSSFLLDEPIPFFNQNNNQVESQTANLMSYRHNLKVAERLDWEVSYFREDLLVNREVYKSRNYKVIFDKSHPQAINLPIYFNPTLDGFNLNINEEEDSDLFMFVYDRQTSYKTIYQDFLTDTYDYDVWITTPFSRFKIQLLNVTQSAIASSENQDFFMFHNYASIASKNISSLNIESLKVGSSILQVSVEGESKAKIVDYLSASIQVLQMDELEKKNVAINNTIDFIDEQLQNIVDTLLSAEQDLQDFRSNNRVVDLNSEASQTFTQFIELEKERSAILLQQTYFVYVEDYIGKNADLSALSVPSATGLVDLGVSSTTRQLVTLSLQKSRLRLSLKENNPTILTLNEQIRVLRSNLLKSVNNLKSTNNIQLKDINERIRIIEKKFAKLPTTEQTLINLRRRYELNNNLYTLLLGKRADAGIAKSSNTYDTEIIDPAIDLGQNPIAPKRKMTLIIGFMVGVLLPISFIYLRSFLNESVTDSDQIKKILKLPVLGEIIHNKSKIDLIQFENSKLILAEGFRTLRTNLQYIVAKNKKKTKVIMVTSSVSGEGKTFISNNLGSIIATGNKRTLVISADLRKNSTAKAFKLSTTIGLTNYLIHQTELESIIQKTSNPYLSVIPAGPIPPNPSELITSDEFKSLIEQLVSSDNYDYIIIDTPPVILFSDAQHISSFADFSVFVVRQRFTKASMLEFIKDKQQHGFLKNIVIVVNDIKPLRGATRYGYGYGSAYSSYASYGYGKKE